jgi:hypothetical protein
MVLNTAAKIHAPFAVPDVEARNASVKRAMQSLLDADLRPDDLRYLLDMGLWRYTEFDKNRYKFAIRYRTAAVLATEPVVIEHEHVVGRRWLLDQIAREPDKLDDILQLAVACIVSKPEHDLLWAVVGFGWERYRAAGIDVIDTVTMQRADLEELASAQRDLLRRLQLDVPKQVVAAAVDPVMRAVIPRSSVGLSGVVAPTSGNPVGSVEDQLLSLSGKTKRRAATHRAVHELLVDAGYTPTLPVSQKADYLSYRDPATGQNFVNLTSTVAHLMRQGLRPQLGDVAGVRLDGRYPQVHLDDAHAVETLSGLALRFKA